MWEPSRANTIRSLLFIILALPVAAALFPFGVFRKLCGRRWEVYVLDVEGEFAFLVDHLERVRCQTQFNTARCFLLARCSFKHKGFTHLYGSQSGLVVLWSCDWSALVAQVLLLQPKVVMRKETIANYNYQSFRIPDHALAPSEKLMHLKRDILRATGSLRPKYVLMAVYVSTSREIEDPAYASKNAWRESVGSELTLGIDFLREQGLDVLLVGAHDKGKAHIPRILPRLTEFAKIGGLEEVALASGCEYLWSENVGACWLQLPFRGQVLETNSQPFWLRHYNYPETVINSFLCVPLRYQVKSDGHLLTFRELFEIADHGAAIGCGELSLIRNSPLEIVEAHHEMLLRRSGAWVEDSNTQNLVEQYRRSFANDPIKVGRPIASTFLRRHPYLLD
jgi:putative glycosyltransferase (TIGR04372 family)